MAENETEQKLQNILKNMPWWGYAIGGGVVLGGVYYVRKHGQAVTGHNSTGVVTGAQPEYQTPDGLNMADLAGMPFGYYDYSAAQDGTSTTGTPSSGNTSGQPMPGGTPTPPIVPLGPSGGQNPPTTGQTLIGTIRARFSGSDANVQKYDSKNPQGVPEDATPGGGSKGILPFSSQVTITGPAVNGPSNLPAGDPQGSTQWYPLSDGGYVSAYDVATVSNLGTGHGGADAGYAWPDWTHATAFNAEHLLTQEDAAV